MQRTIRWAAVLMVGLWYFGAGTAYAQVSNYRFQAIFVSSFIRQIKWPDRAAADAFVVGVWRDERVANVFRSRLQRPGSRSNIQVKVLLSYDQIKDCSLVFVPVTASVSYRQLRQSISSRSILLVTEDKGATSRGSDINLVVRNNRVAFEINRKGTDAKSLKVSAYLIGLGIVKN